MLVDFAIPHNLNWSDKRSERVWAFHSLLSLFRLCNLRQMHSDTHCPVLQTLAGSLVRTLHCLRACARVCLYSCVNLLVWNLSRDEKKNPISNKCAAMKRLKRKTLLLIFIHSCVHRLLRFKVEPKTEALTHVHIPIYVCVCAPVFVAHLFGSVYYLCGMYACLCVTFFSFCLFLFCS